MDGSLAGRGFAIVAFAILAHGGLRSVEYGRGRFCRTISLSCRGAWPNPRLQRTRSASPPSPLSRQPLGGRSSDLLRLLLGFDS